MQWVPLAGKSRKERIRTTGTSVLTLERKHIFRMCYFCASTDREKHELHGWHSAFALVVRHCRRQRTSEK